jgi:Uma2 family endonuclease
MLASMPVRRKKKVWTDSDLESLPKDGQKYELLDGELIMSPVAANHGALCIRLGALLYNFNQRHKLGEVFDSSTGFRLAQNVVLSPDVSFVSKARLKKILIAPDKFLCGAPDLAVEVLSPNDRMREVHRKLDRYFEGGTQVVWWVNWKLEQVHIYTPDSIAALTGPNEVLSGGDVLPGFKCRLSRIFSTFS